MKALLMKALLLAGLLALAAPMTGPASAALVYQGGACIQGCPTDAERVAEWNEFCGFEAPHDVFEDGARGCDGLRGGSEDDGDDDDDDE